MNINRLWQGIQKPSQFALQSLSTCTLCLMPMKTFSGCSNLCTTCYQDLDIMPFGTDVLTDHPALAAQLQTSHLSGLAALGLYQWPLNLWVKQLKFNQQLAHAKTLGELLTKQLCCNSWPQSELLLPLPLHKSRQIKRGFNQSELISQFINIKGIRAKAYADFKRIKKTSPQSELNKKQRKANIKDAFICNRALQGENIILVDDVLTTGATLDEAAKTLLEAGAGNVYAAVVAIQPLHKY